MADEVLFKVIIVGDPSVGKTSFVRRYVNDSFQRDYKMTIGVDFALKMIRWSDKCNIKLQLWDIAGQEQFTSMTRVYYKDAYACIIMFDLNKKSTFENAARWKRDVDTKCQLPDGSGVPCLLLANKCDLGQKEVDHDQIEEMCKENDFAGWSETSVRENIMIDESMDFLMEEMMIKHSELEGFSESVVQGDGVVRHLGNTDAENLSKRRCAC